MTQRRWLLPVSIAAVVLLLFLNGATGTVLFAHARPDPVKRVDAVVVLGGEHDGREAYGLKLAELGYARTVLLSDPYGPNDAVMKRACQSRAGIRVICKAPQPATTRGEAMMAGALAEKYGWHSIMVVSWRYHLPRARKIFNECFASSARTVVMRDVPRAYPFSVAQWQYTYLYQYGGWVKADIQGACPPSAA